MGKSEIQREMDGFFEETENERFSNRRITKSGFSWPRWKLAPEAFLEHNDIIWKNVHKQVKYTKIPLFNPQKKIT